MKIILDREVVAFELGSVAIVAVQGYRRWVIHLHYRHHYRRLVIPFWR